MYRKITILIIGLLFVPVVAFSAFDDVSMTTDTVIMVGDVTVNVSGSTATIQSISVDSSTITVVLLSGSWIKLQAPNRNKFIVDGSFSDYASIPICVSSGNTVVYSSSGDTVTIPITVEETDSACIIPAVSSGRSGSSGSGGGSITTATIPVVPVVAPTSTVFQVQTPIASVTPPSTPQTPQQIQHPQAPIPQF